MNLPLQLRDFGRVGFFQTFHVVYEGRLNTLVQILERFEQCSQLGNAQLIKAVGPRT